MPSSRLQFSEADRAVPELQKAIRNKKVPSFKTLCSTTDEQFYTAAHMAYARGGAGISVFNFHYYRLTGERVDPRVGEPPFHVFEAINDPARVAQMPQHYILNRGSTLPPIPKPMPRNSSKTPWSSSGR